MNDINEPTSSQSSYSPPKKISRNFIKMEDKVKAVNYWKSAKTGKYGLVSVKARFSFATSLKQLRLINKFRKEEVELMNLNQLLIIHMKCIEMQETKN